MDQCIVAISKKEAPGVDPVLVELLFYPHARTPEVLLLREALDNQGGRINGEMSMALVQELSQQHGPWRFGPDCHTLYFYHRSTGVWAEYDLAVRDDLGLRGSLRGLACQFELESKFGCELARSSGERVRQAVNDLAYLEHRRAQAPLGEQRERACQAFAQQFEQWRQAQGPETQQQILTTLTERQAYWQTPRAERRR